MAMHAKSGGNLEIMGMLQGKVHQDTFIVIDVFALPVEGTETRVNAQAEAYEYMVDFGETGKVRTCCCLHSFVFSVVTQGAVLLLALVHLRAESGSPRKYGWMVSQSSWLRVLAVRH
jgi:hypothetical protein